MVYLLSSIGANGSYAALRICVMVCMTLQSLQGVRALPASGVWFVSCDTWPGLPLTGMAPAQKACSDSAVLALPHRQFEVEAYSARRL